MEELGLHDVWMLALGVDGSKSCSREGLQCEMHRHLDTRAEFIVLIMVDNDSAAGEVDTNFSSQNPIVDFLC